MKQSINYYQQSLYIVQTPFWEIKLISKYLTKFSFLEIRDQIKNNDDDQFELDKQYSICKNIISPHGKIDPSLSRHTYDRYDTETSFASSKFQNNAFYLIFYLIIRNLFLFICPNSKKGGLQIIILLLLNFIILFFF